MPYAELQAISNFSFLRGGSHPEELVAQAKALDLAALAIADHNTLAGIVRAHTAAKEAGLRLIVGARLDLASGTESAPAEAAAPGSGPDAPGRITSLLCFPTDRKAYGRLCRLLTLGQRRAEKGRCHITLDDVAAHAEGQILIALPPDDWDWQEVVAHAERPSLPPHEARETASSRPPTGRVIAFPRTPEQRHADHARSSWGETQRGEGHGRAVLPAQGEGQPLAPMPARNTISAAPHGSIAAAHESLAAPLPASGEREMGALVKAAWPVRPALLAADLAHLKQRLAPARLYLAAAHRYRGDDRARIAALAHVAKAAQVPLVATGDVLYHAPQRRPLQDVLACIREHATILTAGLRLEANAERHLKAPAAMARLFAGHEAALARTREIAEACRFSLDELVYEYPDEPVPAGSTPQAHLEDLTWEGARHRFPDGIPEAVRQTLEKELALIAELKYAPYFLTVHDIVRFARARGILCQGRGSAANSAVCYCLAITAVNPAEVDLLFERFISPERREPPDIDVDFEHERREEVIQYIYARYGRERAGLAATVISYRARSAVREVGKAMGLTEDTVAALAGMVWGTRSGGALPEKHVREAGLDPTDPLLATVLELADELIGFPRHLSQHVGGFVLTRGPLSEVVPIGNAAMEDRTFIEWDKDDLDALGLLKVDVLGLGMLTCIRKAFDLITLHQGRRFTLASVPRDDPAVYDMLCRADSLGVFQVESRAQMNMLPRLKPRTFYDLVIEVAIVRPGPIQGDMVHPYLRRRAGLEPEVYPAPDPAHGPPDELRQILGKTKGVPLFQEQAMRIAMVAARFSPAEANELRKAMATFRRRGTIGLLEEKMVSRMVARGYDPEFAARCFNQIKGFGEYGFPESHAASFAHLVYVSSWLKCHYPAAFAAALLNSQPMGFYAPAQIVRDAREHSVEARAVDVNRSDWDSTLEPGGADGGPALRLGFRQVDGFKEADALQLMAARTGLESRPPALREREAPEHTAEKASVSAAAPLPAGGERGYLPFRDPHDLWLRSGLPPSSLERLAAADAFRSMGLDRRQALWDVKALARSPPAPLFAWGAAREAGEEAAVALPEMALSEHVVGDYQTLRLSLKAHPMALLRPRAKALGLSTCADLRARRDGAFVRLAGVVLIRQRPGTAKGVVFMTIEDETGVANAVIWPKILEHFRRVVMAARLVTIEGRIQRHEDIIHVVAARLIDHTVWLADLADGGEAAGAALARADEVRRPEPGSARGASQPRSARHPRAERILPRSRDFH